jgi:ACS family tartrate transporter-like MFS transporter
MPGDVPAYGRAVIDRVTRRILPFLFVSYVIAYIDRVNVGFAASALQRDLGLSDTAFGVGAGLFFFGYYLFEVPSNLILDRVGARRWIARIMIVWGVVSMLTALITDTHTFYIARVALGLAEAGFFPGVVLYLTYWVPAEERARTGALFMMAAPVAIIVGAPVSQAVLALHGFGGLHGWQWLFILEGVPAVVLGVAALWWLTDRPEQAHWLPPGEREWLAATMRAEREARAQVGHVTVLRSLRSGRVWLLCLVQFMNSSVTYGIFLWLPRILEEASVGSPVPVSVLTAIPFVVALAAMVLVGRHSDRCGERKRHVAACVLTAALGLVLAVVFRNNLWLLVLSFTLSQAGQRSVQGVFWAIPPMVLGGSAAAAGIGLINAVGNLGGFFGPTIVGRLRDVTGGYSGGLLVLTGALLIEAALVLSVRLPLPVPGAATARARQA